MAGEFFPGQAPVGGMQSPVISGSGMLDAYIKGAELGTKIPSVGGAIAQGISGGIDAYNKQINAEQTQNINNQSIALNNQKIQAGQMALDESQTPEAVKARQDAIKIKEIETARILKLRSQQEELSGILQGDDIIAKKEALTSGKYAELYASDPNLEKTVTKVVASQGVMDPEELRAYGMSKLQDEEAKKRMEQVEKLRQEYTKKASEYETDPVTDDLMVSHGDKYGHSYDVMRESTEIYPTNKYTTKDNGDLLSGARGEKQDNPDYASKDGETYGIYDKKTGALLRTLSPDDGLSKEFMKRYTGAKSSYRVLATTQGGSKAGDLHMTAMELADQKAQADKLNAQLKNKTGAQPQRDGPAIQGMQDVNQVTPKSPAISEKGYNIVPKSNLPINLKGADIDYQNTPELQDFIGNGLEVPKETFDKYKSSLLPGAKVTEGQRSEAMKSLLKDEFNRMPQDIRDKMFSEEQLKQYNSRFFIGKAGTAKTPEDLYIAQRLPVIANKLYSLTEQLNVEMDRRRRAAQKAAIGNDKRNSVL